MLPQLTESPWPLVDCFRPYQPEDVRCASLWRNWGEAASPPHLADSSAHSLSVCAPSIHFVLPSAGWQRHCVERDALVVGGPHGSRLSHRACLQSSGGGAEGDTRLWCFWKWVWDQSPFRIFHFHSKVYPILKTWHHPFLMCYGFMYSSRFITD